LTTQSNDLVAGALLARSEAIKRKASVSLCSSSNNTTCTATRWEAGWIVRATDGTVIQTHKAAPTGYIINADSTTISFGSSGLAANLTTMTVCRSSPTEGNQERVITINATGKSSVAKTTTGVCTIPSP
jgi:type IV fimbrial biogenesis protein FimT